MKTKLIPAMIAAAAAFGLSACDVDKTAQGNVDMPKYEVTKKKDGDVTLPQYDVKTPDVALNKEEKRVEVPTVRTEERTVTVPDIDVKPAEKK